MRQVINSKLTIFVIFVSLLLAAMLNVYPLSAEMAQFRPMVLITTLFFWVMYKSRYIGLFFTFMIGLSADLLFDTLLGQQAFCALIATFFVRFASQYLKQMGLINSWFVASIGLIIFQSVLWLLQFITQTVFMVELGWSLITSILMWPLLMWLLQKFR